MATAVIMPKFEMAQETGLLLRWLKQPGDRVEKGEPLLEVETDKVTMEVEAPASGILGELQAAAGVTVPIGQTIVTIWAPGEATAAPAIQAVPAARRLARELGVDLQTIQGSGPDGRIQSVDVRQAAEPQPDAHVSSPDLPPILDDSGLRLEDLEQPAFPPKPQPDTPTIRRKIPLTNMRRAIAERMRASVREAPQFALGMEIDMERALAILDDLRALPAATDAPKITLTALLVRVCAWALQRHPRLNASFQETEIIEWTDVNIGVAVAVEDGLLVPIVRQTERLTLTEIAAQLHDLSTWARLGQLRRADLRGGTFTISNLSMFGVDHFTAILNPPQAGILAVGRVAKRPLVLEDGRLEARSQATLTLTADHRVVDGAQAGRFLADLRKALEHPGVLL